MAGSGDARKLSALEALHPDAMETVLLQLGHAEASRLRPVSKKMREAVDRVAWQSLQLEARTCATIRKATACFAPAAAGVAPRIRLAKATRLEFITILDEEQAAREERFQAISALFSACSASSGGIGSVAVHVDMSSKMKKEFSLCIPETRMMVNKEIGRLMLAILEPLERPESEGGSSHSLKNLDFQLEWGPLTCPMSGSFVQVLSRFPRLERLEQPSVVDDQAPAFSAALPALRSAVLRFYSDAGDGLAALASHPALEELDVSVMEGGEGDDRRCNAFGPKFDAADLPSLGRLASLESLELNVDFNIDADDDDDSQEQEQEQEEGGTGAAEGAAEGPAEGPGPGPGAAAARRAVPRLDESLAGLKALRRLHLDFTFNSLSLFQVTPGAQFARMVQTVCRAEHLRGLARVFPALRERYATTARLRIPLQCEYTPDADEALAELLGAAGPALVALDACPLLARGRAFAALAACPRLEDLHLVDMPGRPRRVDSRWKPAPPDWLAQGDRRVLAGLHRLRRLDFDFYYSAHLEPGHLRCLARAFSELCAHSLSVLKLKIFTDEEPGVDEALAELLRAVAPALLELGVGAAVLRGEAAAALAACPRLRGLVLLEPGVPDQPWEPVPVAQAADALTACPALERVSGLIVPLESEQEAAEGLEPLLRLAAARPFVGHRCYFSLRPGAGLQGEARVRALQLARQRLYSAFPGADIETPRPAPEG
eukprot:tig00000219_g19501.t1